MADNSNSQQDLRRDGSRKGPGFFGELRRPDGNVSTELSIGVNLDGKEMEVPSIVPSLSRRELDHLVGGGAPTDSIVNKSVLHARRRLLEGKSPFAGDGEQIAVPKADDQDEPIEGKQDISNDYMQHRSSMSTAVESNEMQEWVAGQAQAQPVKEQSPAVTEAPDPFPTNRKPPARQSTAGTIMRNVGEVPGAIIGGVESAIENSIGFAINPLADWLNKNVADLSYTRDAPATATGKITKSLSEFMTGFLPVTKALQGVGAAEKMGKVGTALTAGAATDFLVRDPHEARLSNLWKEAGLPANVLTDYLAADPSDAGMEGRFKSAAESVLTGAALEGVVLGARAVKSMRQIEKAGKDETLLLKQKYGELSVEQVTKVIGDTTRPLLEAPRPAVSKISMDAPLTAGAKPDDLIGGRGLVKAGDSEVYINFARIDTPDDVKAVIGDMANRYKGSIDEATRGKITHEETKKMAAQMGMSVDDLLARRRGQPLNAEEAVAARGLWAASAEKLLDAAKAAAAPNAGSLEQFAFRRMMATHAAIQSEVIGARTETARALSAWRIPAGGGVEKARAIEQMMESMGGAGASVEFARKLTILAEHGDPQALAKFVEKGWGEKSFDVLREVWINGLLSSPATHVVNTMSNTAVAFQQILERGVAQRIGQMRGTANGVAPGEAMAMTYGLISSIKDAFAAGGKALKTGETGAALNKVDLPHSHALSAETFGMASETGLGRTVDLIGSTFRVPSRLLGAEDEFFKTIGYRMELHAQALRQATAEGKTGSELATRMREILLDPPENIRIAAADGALYSTFTNSTGDIGKAFIKLRERVPAVTFVLPFIKTPVNIARYTFERTPFAPMVQQWRDDIAAGGAREDLALARMGTGSAIMVSALDWADSGLISGRGPKEAGEREAMTRQGWQPYSVKVGDRWYSYNRTDPFGAMLGFSADVSDAIRTGEINEDDVDEWQEVMAMGVAAVAQVAVNKQYLRGLSDFFAVMADPSKKGEGYINNLFASFVPFTSLMGGIERAVDPVVRDSENPWAAARAKLAGLSDSLPPRRNLWGEEIRAESGIGKAYDLFSPVQSREVKPSPIDTEIMRLAPLAAMDNVEGSAPSRIGKRTVFMGVEVNFKNWPQVYDEYVRRAGYATKDPGSGLGAKEFLDDVVTGKNPLGKVYAMQSDASKIIFINKSVQQYRKMAQFEMMNDPQFADFAAHIQRLQAAKAESRMPVTAQ